MDNVGKYIIYLYEFLKQVEMLTFILSAPLVRYSSLFRNECNYIFWQCTYNVYCFYSAINRQCNGNFMSAMDGVGDGKKWS
jgi:hypothetical protein